MIGGEVVDAFERLVTGSQQEIVGWADGLARNEEVHVILRPVLGLRAEQRALGETLEGHEVDGLGGEGLGEPAVQLHEPLQAVAVMREIAIGNLAHPFRHGVARSPPQR